MQKAVQTAVGSVDLMAGLLVVLMAAMWAVGSAALTVVHSAGSLDSSDEMRADQLAAMDGNLAAPKDGYSDDSTAYWWDWWALSKADWKATRKWDVSRD